MSHDDNSKKVPANNKVLKDFIFALLIPLLINKAVMLYFGINYAAHPGEGYGYGLLATVIFLLLGLARLLWKYKDVEDP